MAKAAYRPAPSKLKQKLEKLLPYIKGILSYITLWRLFWFCLFSFIYSSIYWTSVSDKILEYRAKQEPPSISLPANAKFDVITTVLYMKEKRLVIITNINNVFRIIGRDLGIKRESKKYTSVNAKMPVSSKLDKMYDLGNDKTLVEGDLNIIKDNIVDAFKSYVFMLTVKIVSIQNKTGPPVKMVIADTGEMVPYDKTDKILRWSTFIEASSKKYNVDPAIVAAIIEQESGGNSGAGSHAGAIGLMQLMPRTARGLGVNPYDPAQNIDGGTHYFFYQYKRFGNLEQALAAYNSGPGNVLNGNYQYIPETQGYIRNVPRLISKYQRIFAKAKKK